MSKTFYIRSIWLECQGFNLISTNEHFCNVSPSMLTKMKVKNPSPQAAGDCFITLSLEDFPFFAMVDVRYLANVGYLK